MNERQIKEFENEVKHHIELIKKIYNVELNISVIYLDGHEDVNLLVSYKDKPVKAIRNYDKYILTFETQEIIKTIAEVIETLNK